MYPLGLAVDRQWACTRSALEFSLCGVSENNRLRRVQVFSFIVFSDTFLQNALTMYTTLVLKGTMYKPNQGCGSQCRGVTHYK